MAIMHVIIIMGNPSLCKARKAQVSGNDQYFSQDHCNQLSTCGGLPLFIGVLTLTKAAARPGISNNGRLFSQAALKEELGWRRVVKWLADVP